MYVLNSVHSRYSSANNYKIATCCMETENQKMFLVCTVAGNYSILCFQLQPFS